MKNLQRALWQNGYKITKEHTEKRKTTKYKKTQMKIVIMPFIREATDKIGGILNRNNITYKPTKSIKNILNNRKDKINLKNKVHTKLHVATAIQQPNEWTNIR